MHRVRLAGTGPDKMEGDFDVTVLGGTGFIGARVVAECCRQKGVSSLIHVSSIVARYLGDETAVITGATPADPRPEKRGTYAHGKASPDMSGKA